MKFNFIKLFYQDELVDVEASNMYVDFFYHDEFLYSILQWI